MAPTRTAAGRSPRTTEAPPVKAGRKWQSTPKGIFGSHGRKPVVRGSPIAGVPRGDRESRSARPEVPAPASRTAGKPLIQGLRTKALRVVPDERGRLFEMLRQDDELFLKFGQAYCTTVNAGVVKGWHYHKKQQDNFVCVSGMIKLVAYDSRPDSPTKGLLNEFFIGVHHPLLVQIPPGVYHGFKGLTDPEAIVINLSTEPYDHQQPDEYRLPPHTSEIPYDWNHKDG